MYLYDVHTHTHTYIYIYRDIYIVGAAQVTRDFAADLSEVFWHVTWDLCINFAMGLLITNHGGYAPT